MISEATWPVITTTAIGGLGGNVFHGVGIYSQTQTEISRKKLKKLSQMQIIPKLFHYSNSIPQGKIIPIDSDESIPPAYLSRTCICRPFKEPRNRFPAWQAGTTTLFVVPARKASWACGIDSWPP